MRIINELILCVVSSLKLFELLLREVPVMQLHFQSYNLYYEECGAIVYARDMYNQRLGL